MPAIRPQRYVGNLEPRLPRAGAKWNHPGLWRRDLRWPGRSNARSVCGGKPLEDGLQIGIERVLDHRWSPFVGLRESLSQKQKPQRLAPGLLRRLWKMSYLMQRPQPRAFTSTRSIDGFVPTAGCSMRIGLWSRMDSTLVEFLSQHTFADSAMAPSGLGICPSESALRSRSPVEIHEALGVITSCAALVDTPGRAA